MIRWCAACGCFIQFIPIVEPIKGQGVSSRSVSPEQFGQFMIDVFETWRQHDMGEVFVSHFDNALGMQLGMPSSICVHAPQCGDNLVIEHNGDAYSCDHFVYPEFKLGNVRERDYPDLIETPIQQQFSLRKPMGSQLHCQGCSQRLPLCGVFCLFLAYPALPSRNGRVPASSNHRFHSIKPRAQRVVVALHFRIHGLNHRLFDLSIIWVINQIVHFLWILVQMIQLTSTAGIKHQFVLFGAPHALWVGGEVATLALAMSA